MLRLRPLQQLGSLSSWVCVRLCSTQPAPRQHTICAPKWPRGDMHSDSQLGTLEEVLSVGAHVHEYETVAVIETDKVSVDVKSSATGIVVSVLASCGDMVNEKQPLYIVESRNFADSGEGCRQWARRREQRLKEEEKQQERLWETQRLRLRRDWQWTRHQFSSGGNAPGSQRRSTQRETQQWQQWQKRQERMYESAKSRMQWWNWTNQHTARESGHGSEGERRDSKEAPGSHAPQRENPVTRVLVAASHYEVLGVSRAASCAEIKRAFKRLAMEVHPDRCKASKAQEAMVRLVSAYHALSDGSRRRNYDTHSHR
mmetsp:Transcript_20144/g.61287  ORF Transcript_20144/g.61287 Transcript_20144/m.61287 type:complete len:314 (+) Transcript_20144:94-1035(+)